MTLNRSMALLLSLAAAAPGFACGACGCTLNSDWAAQGLNFGPGWSLDLRLDAFDQDRLRTGTREVPAAAYPLPADQEIQRDTLNRNLTLALDWSPSPGLGLSLQIPYYDRTHATVAAGDTAVSTSAGRGPGDTRLLMRWQGLREDHALGLLLGIKLPTGAFTQTFETGPQAGQPLDRGLQRGSGTTDLLAGFFAFGTLSEAWDAYGQALYQAALASREAYRPSAGVTASLGLRYTAFTWILPHLQVNLRMEGRETGQQADTPDSGATLAYISPGAAFPLGRNVQAYGFFQVPVFQRVNGLQLEPAFSVSAGIHVRF